MSGLTKENRKKLDDVLSEYCLSLTRIDNEQSQMKAMEELVKSQLNIDPKHFKTLAKALWRDEREKTQKDIEGQLDLFLLYEPDAGEFRQHPQREKNQVAVIRQNSALQ